MRRGCRPEHEGRHRPRLIGENHGMEMREGGGRVRRQRLDRVSAALLRAGGGAAAQKHVRPLTSVEPVLERIGGQRRNVLPSRNATRLDLAAFTEPSIDRDVLVLVFENGEGQLVERGLGARFTDEVEDAGLDVRHGDVFAA